MLVKLSPGCKLTLRYFFDDLYNFFHAFETAANSNVNGVSSSMSQNRSSYNQYQKNYNLESLSSNKFNVQKELDRFNKCRNICPYVKRPSLMKQ